MIHGNTDSNWETTQIPL